MSQSLTQTASTQQEVKDQLAGVCEPHLGSCQAYGDVRLSRHNDGERIYKDFGIQPFHKYLAKNERHEKNVARYPSAWVAPLVHLNEREIELVESLTGEVDYNPNDPHPSVQELEGFAPLRAKTLEWIAADDGDRIGPEAPGTRTIDSFVAGGTDCHIYGEPGSGKSTLMGFKALTAQQVNNETVLLADTLDDSYTSERVEWLALAPYTTIALPADIPVTVRVVPEDPTIPAFEVDIQDVCRDVVRYDSPTDLLDQLVPGQFYVVYPDPLMRGCRDVSRWSYHGVQEVDRQDDDAPSTATPPDQWWFAFIAARISQDRFMHWTTILVDEGGNLLDPDAAKDDHDSYQKVKWLSEKYADARKKYVTIDVLTHALSEIHEKIRKKQRWWFTMNGTSPPIKGSLPGDKQCPMVKDYVKSMTKGQGQAWNTKNYASVSWPNLKRGVRLDAEISIDLDVRGAVA